MKIVFYGAISLDGYLADEKDNLDWLFTTDLGGISTYEAFEKQVSTLIMGRVTYEEVLKLQKGAPLFVGKEKIIFSNSRQGSFFEGYFSSLDPVSLVKELREKDDPSWVWIVGGGQLFTELVAADLVDEFWIQLAPVLLGKGKRLFPEGDYRQRLEFVETTQMGEMVELHYRKIKK